MERKTFQAHIGDREYEMVLEDGQLTIDGETTNYAFTPIDEQYFALQLNGHSTGVVVEPLPGGRLRLTLHGRRVGVRVKDEKDLLLERFGLEEAAAVAEHEVHAPMPGLVLKVLVEEGQEVEAGTGLLVLEAMKMENELKAPAAGVVKAVHAQAGEPVDKDALLVELEALS